MKIGNALIGWFLIVVALGFYAYGMYAGIELSWKPKTGADGKLIIPPEGIDTSISSLNALLLTNLGAVLGISVTLPNSALSRNIIPGSHLRGAGVKPPLNSRELVQMVCLIVFLLALCGCFVTWIAKELWLKQPIVSYVSYSAKMFIAVLLAYLSFVLGTQQSTI